MEDWETLVKHYKEEIEPKTLQNILNQVQAVLNDDLAPFEIEYILSTLLGKPINILHIVRDKCSKEEWDDCVCDILKLLAKLISKYSYIEIYYKDIVSLRLVYGSTARIRQLVLTCLTHVVPKCALPATDVHTLLNMLEETKTCVAPLVLLIGAICEHRPEQISEHFNRTWRIFLNLLDDNQKTPSIKKAVLEGILSLFKHYGLELTTIELDQFYVKLTIYIKTPKFQDVCLSIFEEHSNLFREKLSNDSSFRAYLWNVNKSRSAILSVYKCVADTVNEAKLRQLIAELDTIINSSKYYNKFTALYAVLYINTKCVTNANLNDYVDIQTVDFEIRNGNINHEICDALFWCVKSRVLYSDRLLQCALLFYENFTQSKRKELLQCFVEADVSIRKPASIFLVNYPQSLVWKDLLGMVDENDNVNLIIKYVQNYITNILEREESNLIYIEVLPNNIKSLASILAFLPPLSTFRVLSRYAKVHREFVPAAVLYGNDIRGENISLEHCLNDEDKVRCSVSYVDRNDYVVSEMIIALETILSSNGASALNIKKAINKLEKLIQRKQLNEEISKMLYKVHIVFQRIDKSKKDGKILERDVILFMAQYGRHLQETQLDNIFIKQLEDLLIWEVDNSLKVKLTTIIIQAMQYENVDALNILYKLLCTKLALNKDVTLRKAFLSVVTKLSRYDVNHDVSRDVTSRWEDVDGVMELFQFIIQEKSMKARRAACNILEEVLRSDGNFLLEKCLEMIVEQNDSNNQSMLDLLEICTKILEEDTLLTKKFLPNIILKVLNIKKYNNYVFNTIVNLFTDKIELFDTNTIDNTIDNILKIINKMGNEDRLNITMALNFIKKVFDLEKNNKSIIDYYFNGNESFNLYILIDIKIIFQLDDSKCEEIIGRDDFLEFFDDVENGSWKSAVFEFVRVFSDCLLKTCKRKTISAIKNCLDGLSPEQMSFDNIIYCLSLLDTNYEMPHESMRNILKTIPLEEITEGIEKYSLAPHHEVYILALKTILESAEHILMESLEVFKRWFERIAVLHDLGVIERNLGGKMECLTDLVYVSLRFVSNEMFGNFLLKNDSINFCRTFIKATFDRLIKRPYIILSSGAPRASAILLDIVQCVCVKGNGTEENKQQALGMVEAIWPVFSTESTHEDRLQVLTYLPSLPPGVEQWVVDTVSGSGTKLEVKIGLVCATSDKISSLNTWMHAQLPSRVTELRGVSATGFRMSLDVLARNNVEVLEHIAQMVANDKTRGWWDEAIQISMSAVAAAGEGPKVLELLHARRDTRLLVPLLRCSKSSDVQEFFAHISGDIISTLSKFPRSTPQGLNEECVLEYTRVLNISQAVLEKVPKENIDKNFVKTVCKLCDTLRGKVDGHFREFHLANYNCLVAAICLMDPGPAVYRRVFEPHVWVNLIDETLIDLPITEQWNQRITRHATCNSTPQVTLTMASARTLMFTRTLSEDPDLYDLTRGEDADTVQFQEIIVKDNILNGHPCIASFKTLFNKRNGIEDDICRKSLEDTLKNNNIHVNVRWLLAQAVCNSKEELKAYASGLQPALLALVVDTTKDGILNDLHVDVLDTLILWQENTENEHINVIVGFLITTAIHYGVKFYSLVERLVKLLNVWQKVEIPWDCFEEHLRARNADKLKICLHILKNILKCNKYIQESAPSLIRLIETKQTYLEVCEVLGMALQMENDRQWLERFRSTLQVLHRNDVMEYLKVLYYTQVGCPSVCDSRNCRKIADLLPKITAGREKLKCLRILDAYIRNAGNEPVTDVLETVDIADHLGTSEGLKLAKTSLSFLSLAAREKLISAFLRENYKKELYEHVEEFLIEYLKLKLHSDYEPPAKRPARESKSLLLCDTDMLLRKILSMLSNFGGKCVQSLSELLNDDLRVSFYECFYIMILMSNSKSEMNLVRTVQLFLCRFKFGCEASTSDSSGQLNREETIDMILKYSKINSEIALSILVQLFHKYPKGSEFDYMNDDIVDLLLVPTRWALEIVRAAGVWRCGRLNNTIKDLIEKTKGTDIENLSKILYEEYKIHTEGPELFTLGLHLCYDENMPEVSTRFSMQDLVNSFGKLSNWSDLTLRQQKSVKDELPCLWTTAESFKHIITERQFEGPMWLNAMISAYNNDSGAVIPHDVFKPPRNYFDLSVVAEISTWNEIRSGLQTKEMILTDIQPSDCLARWAARVMMRSLFLGAAWGALSRSHAARWCARASETEIHYQVRNCCKTTTDLYESEMLQWLYFKLSAMRCIALEENNKDELRKALDISDEHVPKFLEMSSHENIIKMDLVTLQLRDDLKCLNTKHINDICIKIQKIKENKMAADYKKNLESICVLFMTFLDQCDNNKSDVMFANSICSQMARVLSIYVQLNLGKKRWLLANIMINKIKRFGTVFRTESGEILDLFSLMVNDLDCVSIEQLVGSQHVFPSPHPLWARLDNKELDRVKRHLSLIGDPQYLLLRYCQRLMNAKDIETFDETMKELKMAIFENDLAQECPDYQILNKFKVNLYNINFEDNEKKKQILSSTTSQLDVSRDSVRLSRTCGALAGASETATQLAALLRLPRGVTVASFEDKVEIMQNTLHRPAVVTARRSDGRSLRFLVKRGAQPRTHYAATALNRALGLRRAYWIEPLNDTCCVIEYLDNHEPFRKMITGKYNIDIPEISKRTNDKELILNQKRSLEEFQSLLEKLPSYMLRHAIEENCISVEDFINKKKNFMESVCDMTVFSYICGLDDRHLENMMYNKQDGGACHVDCDAILQDGGDIPPARLTRNVLAVCDVQALEARVQARLAAARRGRRLGAPSLALALAYAGDQYVPEFHRIENIIAGKTLSFNTTIERLTKMSHKERYVELLKQVFADVEERDEYSVEEQVSSLLRQSTDHRLLSVTRSNWEPWI